MLSDRAPTDRGCCREPILNAQAGNIRLASATVPVRTVALLAGALVLGGCDTLSSLNPFDKTERYKMEIVPEVPAGQLYDLTVDPYELQNQAANPAYAETKAELAARLRELRPDWSPSGAFLE